MHPSESITNRNLTFVFALNIALPSGGSFEPTLSHHSTCSMPKPETFEKYQFLYSKLDDSLPHRLDRVNKRIFSTRMNSEEAAIFQSEEKVLEKNSTMKPTFETDDIIPNFGLSNHAKRVYSNSDFADGNMVICFRSGHWNDWDNEELKCYYELDKRLRILGAYLLWVSPEPMECIVKQAHQISVVLENKRSRIYLLSDELNRYAEKFGILYQPTLEMIRLYQMIGWNYGKDNGTWELPYASTFVVGKDGKIKWWNVETNLRKRCHPEVVLQQLNKLKKTIVLL